MLSVVLSLLLLDVLGENLVVLGSVFSLLLEAFNLASLGENLSSESLLSNESLDLGRLEEGLVTLLDFTSNNVLSNVVLLSKSEDLSDGGSSLGSKSSGLNVVGNSIDVLLSLLDDSEGDNSKVGAADATSD